MPLGNDTWVTAFMNWYRTLECLSYEMAEHYLSDPPFMKWHRALLEWSTFNEMAQSTTWVNYLLWNGTEHYSSDPPLMKWHRALLEWYTFNEMAQSTTWMIHLLWNGTEHYLNDPPLMKWHRALFGLPSHYEMIEHYLGNHVFTKCYRALLGWPCLYELIQNTTQPSWSYEISWSTSGVSHLIWNDIKCGVYPGKEIIICGRPCC